MSTSSIAYEVTEASYAFNKSNPPVLVVTAKGKGNTGGWTNPTLEPNIYIHPPEDGIYTFELFAQPPAGPVVDAISLIEGEAHYEEVEGPPWFKGIRVKAKANEIVVANS